MENKIEIIYVGDPMCTWCWAISEQFRIFRNRHPEISFSLIMGGIRAGEHSLDLDLFRDGLRKSWNQAAQESGQIYNFAFFERQSFLYDSEPSCRAVITAGKLNPSLGFVYKEKLEHAFYVLNEDITNSQVLADKAAETGLDRKEFLDLFLSNELKLLTQKDFDYSDTLDVRGFPSILVKNGEKTEFFCKGFVHIDELELLLNNYMHGKHTNNISHPVCDITKPDSC